MSINIRVIYEDEHLIIVNKPANLLVVPTPKKEKNTLTDILKAYPCHRLDRETSGLIIFAKSKEIQGRMAQQFKDRLVKKKYIAFVHGHLSRNEGIIKNRIEGQEAVTKYRVMDIRKDFSIIEALPITGRTNQIRLHFKQIGHPCVGESRFAFRKDFKLKFKRAALHAAEIEFMHPVTGKPMRFKAPLAKDMEKFGNA